MQLIWDQFVQALLPYSSVVLTGIDGEGYPYSIRLRLDLDAEREVMLVPLPEPTAIQPGPASVLAHSYDDKVWNQTSVMIRGTLERSNDGAWILRPTQVIPGFGRSPAAMMRLLRLSRRQAASYLKKRNLPRPTVAWDEVKALWEEVKTH